MSADESTEDGGTGAPQCERTAGLPGRAVALGTLVIVALTVVAYLPALGAGFIWDDDAHVTNNMVLRSLGGLQRIWLDLTATPQYYPLVHTSFWFEYQLWKLWPAGYHLDNLLLHALGAVLLWHVLRHLALPGAFVAATIFALHPVQVETVAWITERKNVLSGALYMASMLAFFRFRPLHPEVAPAHDRQRFYRLSLGLFIAALLSKTVVCSLPAVILLLMWWKLDRVGMRDVRALAPFFVIGASFAALTVWLERAHVGAGGAEWTLSFGQRCLIAGRALWFYAGKLAWPTPLIFNYPHWRVDTALWWQYLFPLGAVAVVFGLWMVRRRLGRGPLVAVLIFAGTLFPALGFFNVYPMRYSFVADHFQYLASIGLIALFVSGAAKLALRRAAWGPRLAAAGSTALFVVLGVLVWNQSQIYQDRPTLWRDTIRKNPNSWLALTGLGVDMMHQDRLDEAVEHFRAAIKVNPDYPGAQSNLGIVLYRQGKRAEAIRHLEIATQIAPEEPRTHNNLAEILARQGLFDRAVRHFREAIRINPDYADAHYNLGNVLAKTGKYAEAAQQFREVLRIDPGNAEARRYLERVQAPAAGPP